MDISRKAYYWIPLTASLLLYNGCMQKDSPTGDDIIHSAIPESTVIPKTWESLAAQPGEVDQGWLKSFNDRQLEELVDEALYNNLGLRAAAANVTSAEALAVQAGASLKPAIGLGGASGKTYGGSALDTSAWSVNISWELDLWGKIKARAKAGEEAYRATVAEYEYARLSRVGQVAKNWFLATEILLQKNLALENVEIFEKTLEYARNRHRLGKVTSQDVHLAAADLASTQAALRTIQNTQMQITRSLELLLGRYPAAELEVRSTFVSVPKLIPAGIPSELLERRPDVVAAERQVAAAFQKAEEAKAARLPSFSLTAAGGQSSNDLINLLGVNQNFFNVGANFIAPLYSGGVLEAQVVIQTANQEKTLASYGQTALKAFSEVENGLSNERLLSERQSFLNIAVKENEDALRVAKKQHDVGMIDLFTVLQIQARVNSARSQLISVQNDRLAQRVDLHMALGGSF